jgi:hypothetical protein
MTASWTHGPRESLETQLKDKIAYREDLLGRLAFVVSRRSEGGWINQFFNEVLVNNCYFQIDKKKRFVVKLLEFPVRSD